MGSAYSIDRLYGGGETSTTPTGHTTEPAQRDARTRASTNTKDIDLHLQNSSSTTFTLLAWAALTGALAAKAIRSSQRARQASHDARAWKQTSLALINNNRNARTANHSRFSNSTLKEKRGKNDHEYGTSARESVESLRESITRVEEAKREASARKTRSFPDYIRNTNAQDHAKLDLPSEAQSKQQNQRASETQTFQESLEEGHRATQKRDYKPNFIASTQTTRLLYSEIHPHEDWDWTPADHPRPSHSWKRHRLPSWSIGFTSAPTVKAKEQVVTEEKTSSLGPEDMDEWLIHSAIWPDSDPLRASEAAMIADEVFKEAAKQPGPPIPQAKPITQAKNLHPSPEQDRHHIQALERQIWALLARAQAMEDKLREK